MLKAFVVIALLAAAATASKAASVAVNQEDVASSLRVELPPLGDHPWGSIERGTKGGKYFVGIMSQQEWHHSRDHCRDLDPTCTLAWAKDEDEYLGIIAAMKGIPGYVAGQTDGQTADSGREYDVGYFTGNQNDSLRVTLPINNKVAPFDPSTIEGIERDDIRPGTNDRFMMDSTEDNVGDLHIHGTRYAHGFICGCTTDPKTFGNE
jgi:hypothetical protein